MSTIAYIQARLGSTRLPGKVLLEANGITILHHMIKRVKLSKLVDEIVIITTSQVKDDRIIEFCNDHNILTFRGSENDVLDRYKKANDEFKASTIVRLTSDCPLIDPEVIDNCIKIFQENDFDYVSNTTPPDQRNYPDGSDVEVFSNEVLQKAWKEESSKSRREHVTFQFYEEINSYKHFLLKNTLDWKKYRLTLDFPEDYELILLIIKHFNMPANQPSLAEIISFLDNHPEAFKLNSNYYHGMNW